MAEPGAPHPDPETDRQWMSEALDEARAAPRHGDVPAGCVVVREGRIIARAHNRREADADPTAHAELLALRAAAEATGAWRLTGCTVYATLEPCPMCAGALVLARVDRLVYGATDPKAGACGSLYDLPRDGRLNHRVAVSAGILEDDCGTLLRTFFQARRS
jgi:tRNA(adenine34) deaminase